MDRLSKWIEDEQNAVVPDIVLRRSEETLRKIAAHKTGDGSLCSKSEHREPSPVSPVFRRKRRRFRFGLVVAAASLLIMGVFVTAAVRSGWIASFLEQEKGALTEEEINEVEAFVSKVDEQEETSFASVTMTEAYYDGKSAILHFRVVPQEGQALMLIPGGYSVYDDRGLLMGNDAEGVTMLQLLQDENSPYTLACGVYPRKTEILSAAAPTGQESGLALQKVDFLLQPDDSLEAIYYLRFWTFEATRDINCQFSVKPYREPFEDDETEPGRAEDVSFPVTLEKAAEESPVLTWTGAAEYPEAGVRVDAVEIRETPIELQYEIHYTITDPERFTSQDFLFEWVSSADVADASVRLQPGVTGQFARTLDPAADGTSFVAGSSAVEAGSLALSEKKDAYLLRMFSIDTRERTEAIEIIPQ